MEIEFVKNFRENKITVLREKEELKRQKKFGYNETIIEKGRNILNILLFKFRNIFIFILITLVLTSFYISKEIEVLYIVFIIIFKVFFNFFINFKIKKTLKDLKDISFTTSKAIRDEEAKVINEKFLVNGDVVIIENGDKLSADGRLIESNDLNVNESITTGEIGAVLKEASSSIDVVDKKSLLENSLKQLGEIIDVLGIFVCVLIFFIGVTKGEGILDMFLLSASLGLLVILESLTTTINATLLLSIKRLSRKGILIKNIKSVERLGCVNVVCVDKTGVLTENKMTVTNFSTYNKFISVGGIGYNSKGFFSTNDLKINVKNHLDIKMLLEIAVICNNANIKNNTLMKNRNRTKNETNFLWNIEGSPTEIALLVMSAKGFVYKQDEKLGKNFVAELTFTSDRRMMTVIYKESSGFYLYTKGATENVLSKCNFILDNNKVRKITSIDILKIKKENDNMSAKGFRVLCFAYKKNSKNINEDNLIFVGLTYMVDNIREGVRESVISCLKASVKPVMLTGDSLLTAKSIAKKVNIYKDGDITITGDEIDNITNQQFKNIINDITVFARIDSSHKLKIVKAFKQKGQIVAMTGYKRNDEYVMRDADIGISMSLLGTLETKKVADIVLVNDNFSAIVDSIKEGRVIYRNIRKFIRYILSSNVGHIVTILFSLIIGMPIVLLPIQILFANLFTGGLIVILLGAEKAEKNIMLKKPRRKEEIFFSKGLLNKIFFRGSLIGFSILGAYSTVFFVNNSTEISRSAAFFTLILCQLIYAFECKNEDENILYINCFDNLKLFFYVLISLTIVLLIIHTPFFNNILYISPLSLLDILICCFYMLLGLLIPTFIKKWQ
ncbi:MAG: cation-translocating P-type ATPase [Oscillospiraceae bacterium]